MGVQGRRTQLPFIRFSPHADQRLITLIWKRLMPVETQEGCDGFRAPRTVSCGLNK